MTDDTDDEISIRRGRRAWTPEDDAQLADLRQGGHPDEIIGLMMTRTTAAVHARVSKLKAMGAGNSIPSRKRPSRWTPERVGQARALRAEGLTLHQIGRRLGSDAATVSRAIRSPETTEDSPGEGVRVGRTVPDHNRTAADVEAARAALARAEARHREALEPVLAAMREAVRKAGYVQDSDNDGDDDAELMIVNHLRRQGIELRVRT